VVLRDAAGDGRFSAFAVIYSILSKQSLNPPAHNL
jgi:hypothetical protein